MKIAQVAPLIESVPPRLYGGTERVVSYLTEELVRLGHDVTLFASGDSVTSAELVACIPGALRLDPSCSDPLPHNILMLEQVRQRAEDFDILHFHVDYLHFPLFRNSGVPTVTTLHGRLDLPDLVPLYREFDDIPLVSISLHQRKPIAWANWAANIPHGLPKDLYPLSKEARGGYLAFLGRICSEKRPDRAVEIAQRAGMPLRIAAKVDRADAVYFEEHMKPLLHLPGIEYVGEIGEWQKGAFLGDAAALLFPIDWPEPFGLTMIEAMACGTPVIAWRCGSVPEVIEEGVTGFIVDSVEQAVAAVEEAQYLDRARVRQRFEERFSARRMANDYLALYESLKFPSSWSPELAGDREDAAIA
jgi:glycosyltransferase involved in cell wall biosynthesis